MKRRIIAFMLCAAISLAPVAASAAYLPGVSEAMTNASFWEKGGADFRGRLLDAKQIEALNALVASEPAANMNDLKAHPLTIDALALRDSLKRSAEADAKYYTGWTYDVRGNKAGEEFYGPMIANTQSSAASNRQEVMYAVAVVRTTLRSFPSDEPILDDPADPDFDYQHVTGVRVNEPLILLCASADEKYYCARSVCCSGWVAAEDVAICSGRDEWLSAWDIPDERSVVVYAPKAYTEASNNVPAVSMRMLTMGTTLEACGTEDLTKLVANRAVYHNIAVWLPVRNADGSYSKEAALIPEHFGVSRGPLELTRENILSVAFGALGDAYGWGGMLYSQDCSGFVRDVYKCFGMEIPRNTTWQAASPVFRYDLKDTAREEKELVLDSLPAGAVLFFSGHEMLYLGKYGGEYYVVSSASSIMDPYGSGKRQRLRSVSINSLGIKRANGNTWLNSLNAANVPDLGMFEGSSYPAVEKPYYHDAVAFVISAGLMKGFSDGYFRPEDVILDEHVGVILSRCAEKAGLDPSSPEIVSLGDSLRGKTRAQAAEILMDRFEN